MNERLLIGGLMLGVMVGILIGWLAGPDAVALTWVGDLFLDLLKMLVLPLVVPKESAIIAALLLRFVMIAAELSLAGIFSALAARSVKNSRSV